MAILFVTVFCSTPGAQGLNSNQKISLELENVPINTALNMIARQYNLNIVIPGDIDDRVTIRLNNVDLASALNALLTSNGLNYYFSDDIIVVKKIENDAVGELTFKLVTLLYADAITAKKALDSRKSEKGKVVILDKKSDDEDDAAKHYTANRILISDYPNVLAEQLKLIKELDIPERLISISVKIIESQVDKNSKLGFLWPSLITANFGRSDSGLTSTGFVQGVGELNPNDGSWTWGKLNVEQLALVLDLLSKSGKTKLISDPHLTVTENYEAEIRSEIIIPVQTINRFTQGSATSDIVTFEDIKVGITLKVTPRINGDGEITMDVFPTVQNILSFVGTAENQKPIKSSRSIRTRVTVKSGETLALGGLLSENESEVERKVPFLGSIPLLGKWLFTHKSIERTKTDLLILITPTIVN
ncbi:MAG: hypothetical protein IID63_03135 [candidate division Zixibacteria bacterium]|nr:hypothetical protein [candidate division Zixibacteria bacterium]